MIHLVKITPQYFNDVILGYKTFEVRYNDRQYQVGDYIILEEYSGYYSGRFICKEICYILDNPNFCKSGFVVLGLRDIYR